MASDKERYIFIRDATDSDRLNSQHRFYSRNVSYTLHPSIVASLPANARIADVGTGTGAFLLDAAAEHLSSWTFDGFDVDPSYFPSDKPSNVLFHTVNAKEPFPAEFHGQFDAVTMRLLAAAMSGLDDYSRVARHVAQILKPGGAVQWVEQDYLQGFTPLSSDPAMEPKALQTTQVEFLAVPGIRDKATNTPAIVAEKLRDAGFSDLKDVVVSSDRLPEMRIETARLQLQAIHSIMKTFKQEPSQKLVEEGYKEIENGAYFRWDIHVQFGWKS